MARITFRTKTGDVVVDNALGNLMEIATYESVEGIDADCGGVCSCATCMVRVPPEWRDKLNPPEDSEADLLDIEEAGEGVRLSCQIEVTDAMDGMVVEIPQSGED